MPGCALWGLSGQGAERASCPMGTLLLKGHPAGEPTEVYRGQGLQTRRHHQETQTMDGNPGWDSGHMQVLFGGMCMVMNWGLGGLLTGLFAQGR